jgi:hypothetical protein
VSLVCFDKTIKEIAKIKAGNVKNKKYGLILAKQDTIMIAKPILYL